MITVSLKADPSWAVISASTPQWALLEIRLNRTYTQNFFIFILNP